MPISHILLCHNALCKAFIAVSKTEDRKLKLCKNPETLNLFAMDEHDVNSVRVKW